MYTTLFNRSAEESHAGESVKSCRSAEESHSGESVKSCRSAEESHAGKRASGSESDPVQFIREG